MKNKDQWTPNKFLCDTKSNKWVPNINYPGIGNHSYIIASRQIIHYQQAIKKHATGFLIDCGYGDVPFYGIYKELSKVLQNCESNLIY